MSNISSGSWNTAVGQYSGNCTTGGCSNSFFGSFAGNNVLGDCNIYIGNNSGVDGLNNFTGNNNIVIGYDTDPSSASVSNEVTIGNTSINSLRIPGLQSGASDGDVLTYSSTSGNITLQTPSGGGQGFPFDGDAVISGSLTVSGSTPTGTSFTLENGHVVLAQVSQSLNYADDTAAAA